MGSVRNILFVMCDQLRWDYLSCYGHPHLRTPNIDALATKGVRFTNAFVQSASCGPSRMSYYTGRYVTSHRSFANFVPLPIDELTLGDYLHSHGLPLALVGKTHVEPNYAALDRLQIDRQSPGGKLLLAGGFFESDRHDGVLADPGSDEALTNQYTSFLKRQGYESPNPWLDFANSAEGENRDVLSGWHMRYAQLPARVREEHSETAYTTEQALAYIRTRGESPWCLHLSYIKPHWPYVAPAPYHAIYTADDILPACRSSDERKDAHPLYASYLKHQASREFSRDAVRDTVVPVYMGLVKQIDDHLGRLFEFLERSGRMSDTMIVFTSDHGDYLGDHYLGEKELYHDSVNRVPLIVYDPDARADGTRGSVCALLVESIDIVPTILDALGAHLPMEILEGRTLLPLLCGHKPLDWRSCVYSELDYSFRGVTRLELGRQPRQCETFTIRTERWKYTYVCGFRPILFDLQSDPDEFRDLGADSGHGRIRQTFDAQLFHWLVERKRRTTVSDAFITNFLEQSRFSDMAIGQW